MSLRKTICVCLALFAFAGLSIAKAADKEPHPVAETIHYALFVRLEAKPGKEQALADFLDSGLAMANRETTTPIWFALRLSPTTFGIFDAFSSDQDRQTHLTGPIAQALGAHAAELLAKDPMVEPIDVLGLKNQPVSR